MSSYALGREGAEKIKSERLGVLAEARAPSRGGAEDDEVEEAQRLLRDPATRVVTATAWLGTGRTPGV